MSLTPVNDRHADARVIDHNANTRASHRRAGMRALDPTVNARGLAALVLAATMAAVPARAQAPTDPTTPAPTTPAPSAGASQADGSSAAPAAPASPAPGTNAAPPPPTPSAAIATAPPPGGDATGMLQVATVKLTNGWRASKLMGAAVHNEAGDKIGSVEDLVLTREDKITVAVVSVGGFLGLGGKLVAVPWDRFRYGADEKLQLPGATKEALAALPAFTFGS